MTCRNGTHYRCDRCADRAHCLEYAGHRAINPEINLKPICRPWLETPKETEATNRFYGID